MSIQSVLHFGNSLVHYWIWYLPNVLVFSWSVSKKNIHIINTPTQMKVKGTYQMAHVIHVWKGFCVVKAVCSAAVFQSFWLRQATQARYQFSYQCVFSARTIIIITGTAGLLFPTKMPLGKLCATSGQAKNWICHKDIIICGVFFVFFYASWRPKEQMKKEEGVNGWSHPLTSTSLVTKAKLQSPQFNINN